MEVLSMSKSPVPKAAAKGGVALIMFASLGIALSACGAATSSESSGARHALVTGSVHGYGGPIRVIHGKVADNRPWPIDHMVVLITQVGSPTIHRVDTNGSGTFSIKLADGHYKVAASCEAGRTTSVHLHAGQAASVHLACDYP
jgi:Carboxypeptidase regulatory-like domain